MNSKLSPTDTVPRSEVLQVTQLRRGTRLEAELGRYKLVIQIIKTENLKTVITYQENI